MTTSYELDGVDPSTVAAQSPAIRAAFARLLSLQQSQVSVQVQQARRRAPGPSTNITVAVQVPADQAAGVAAKLRDESAVLAALQAAIPTLTQVSRTAQSTANPQSQTSSGSSSSNTNTIAIAAGVGGGVALIAVAAAVTFYSRRAWRRRQSAASGTPYTSQMLNNPMYGVAPHDAIYGSPTYDQPNSVGADGLYDVPNFRESNYDYRLTGTRMEDDVAV